jgi:cell wall-associated NlpC family hydrolase
MLSVMSVAASRYLPDPERIEVFDACFGQWHATFTIGAQTVTMTGPPRRLREGRRMVEHSTWVRLYPEPFNGANLDLDWLSLALGANDDGVPDILGIAFQYTAEARRLYDGDLQIAGNARYGPRTNGAREEGADFSDYLGVAWTYTDDPPDTPEPRQIRCLDCSGFVRMVYGYRRSLPSAYASSVPLCRTPNPRRSALPRRAHEMLTSGPGVELVADAGSRAAPDTLVPGDLVFFDADEEDGPRLDHVGIYLGTDTKAHHRFISSRKRANGPTIDDVGGRSILDGDGFYARAFRAARRV